MDVSVKSDARFEVSISFGRFDNDALAWEKWSSFSPNKYFEEVGTLSTPGSVAQKKAYFEAHYKKIAAKKGEELEHEEKSVYLIIPISNVARKEDSNEISSDSDVKHSSSNGVRLVADVTEEPCDSVLSNATETDINVGFPNGEGSVEEPFCSANTYCEARDDNGVSRETFEQGESLNSLIDAIDSHEEKQNDAMESIEETKDHSIDNAVDPKLDSREEANLSSEKVEKIPERTKVVGRSSALKKEKPKVNSRYLAQKATPIKEKDSAASKKKVITPSSNKSLQTSNPYKQPKPTLMSTSLSSAQSLKKLMNSSPLPKSKSRLEGNSKKTPPTSLHMPISLGPTNPSSDSVTRKSLIMDKMGDKDIVKRAFKAFQNRGVSTNEKQVVSSPSSEPKVATSRTPAKRNEGLKKDAKKPATPKSNSLTRSHPLPSRKNLTSPSPASALRSNGSAEKRKEFVKLEAW